MKHGQDDAGVGGGCGSYGRVGQIAVPLKITGTISEPKVELDWAALAKENSGIPFLQSVLKSTWNIGVKIGDAIQAPFTGGSAAPSSAPNP